MREYKIEDLIKICKIKVDENESFSFKNPICIFVYNSELFHHIFVLTVWKNERKDLSWRMYIDKELSREFNSEEINSLIGSYLYAEIDDNALLKELESDVAKGYVSKKDFDKITSTPQSRAIEAAKIQINSPTNKIITGKDGSKVNSALLDLYIEGKLDNGHFVDNFREKSRII